LRVGKNLLRGRVRDKRYSAEVQHSITSLLKRDGELSN
jgi:hypothetical protein